MEQKAQIRLVRLFENVDFLGVICFPELNTAISSPNTNLNINQDIGQNNKENIFICEWENII